MWSPKFAVFNVRVLEHCLFVEPVCTMQLALAVSGAFNYPNHSVTVKLVLLSGT